MPLESDPIDLLLDADGDLDITGGDLSFVAGLPAVAQLIKIALQMFLGEWFLNVEAGVPWLQDVLGNKYDPEKVRAALRPSILEVPAVTAILSLETAFHGPTRVLSVSFEVSTEFGDTSGTVDLEF